MEREQIDEIFTYHAPRGTQAERYRVLRGAGRYLAHMIFANCPQSRERDLAITAVQQAIMWANASIAITESKPRSM